MKIIVATNRGGLEDDVSPVFGRCQTFTIIEAEGNEIKNVEVLPNQFSSAIHGAGVQTGQWVVSQGAKAVIAGNFGPNVTAVLQQAGIEMITAQGNVKDVVERYLKGELKGSPTFTGFTGYPGFTGFTGFTPSFTPPMQPFSYPYPRYPFYSYPHQISKEDEIKLIEEELRKIEDLLSTIKKRLKELKK